MTCLSSLSSNTQILQRLLATRTFPVLFRQSLLILSMSRFELGTQFLIVEFDTVMSLDGRTSTDPYFVNRMVILSAHPPNEIQIPIVLENSSWRQSTHSMTEKNQPQQKPYKPKLFTSCSETPRLMRHFAASRATGDDRNTSL